MNEQQYAGFFITGFILIFVFLINGKNSKKEEPQRSDIINFWDPYETVSSAESNKERQRRSVKKFTEED